MFNFLPSLKWYPYGKTGSCWICCLDINISLCLQIHNVNLFWIALYCCSCMQPPQAKLRRGMHVQSSTAMLISIPRCELPLLPSKPKKSSNTKLHLSLCTRVLNFTFILIFFLAIRRTSFGPGGQYSLRCQQSHSQDVFRARRPVQ